MCVRACDSASALHYVNLSTYTHPLWLNQSFAPIRWSISPLTAKLPQSGAISMGPDSEQHGPSKHNISWDPLGMKLFLKWHAEYKECKRSPICGDSWVPLWVGILFGIGLTTRPILDTQHGDVTSKCSITKESLPVPCWGSVKCHGVHLLVQLYTSSRDVTAAGPVPNVFETETLKATVVMNGRFYLRKIIWIRKPLGTGCVLPRTLWKSEWRGKSGKWWLTTGCWGAIFCGQTEGTANA